ncbi:MAG TPA: hypothetical protein GXZ22_06575 [Clostridiaceae bacterium]|nr:hypothetical protein [Clostridiaceae bacterium]
MYNVSLLPYEYKLLNQQARKKDYTLLIAIALMCCLLLTYFILSVISARKDSALEDAKAINSDIEEQIASLVSIEELNNEMRKLNDKAENAVGTTPIWADIIADIGNTVKPNTSITDIKMSYNDKSGEGVINGTAYDISSLTKWLDELEDVSGIDDAQFSISSTSGSNQLIRFELNFTVLPAFLNNSQEVVD